MPFLLAIPPDRQGQHVSGQQLHNRIQIEAKVSQFAILSIAGTR
jgi:hypothetical protein